MERSSKHGARLDDAMSAETESLTRGGREARAEEWREMEPAGDDQPMPDSQLAGEAEGLPPVAGVPGREARELRSELAASLRMSVWPADRARLEAVARDEDAPQRVIDLIHRLPASERFANLGEVWRTLGGDVEEVRA